MNTFSETMSRLEGLEVEVKRMVTKLKEDLTTSVSEQKFEGELLSTSLLCGMVSASTFARGKCWSPDYYFPVSQASAVMEKLKNCVTAKQVCKAVKTMLEEKRVKIGGSVTYLNEDTLNTLRNSELGQYVKGEDSEPD